MKITIVGGGNIGTLFAVHCSSVGHEVVIYSSSPGVFRRKLSIVNESYETILEGNICYATNDPEDAFPNADVIFITFPARMMKSIADVIYRYTRMNTIIGVIPGSGGCECAFEKFIKRGNVFFGMERVPAISRLIEKGKTVRAIGYRNELHISMFPSNSSMNCCRIIENVFDIKCRMIPCYLNITMIPSNSILHTTRLYTIFRDYKEGDVYETLPLFYEEWDDKSSELLILCDEEVQNICHTLSGFLLDNVKSLKEHYGCFSVCQMTKKIRSILAFKGIKTPCKETNGGFVPDLESRYFTSDFSYGLSIINQIADFEGVRVPNIKKVLNWYNKIRVVNEEFKYSDYGIYSKDDFERFYLR